jgi:hypothetical protein
MTLIFDTIIIKVDSVKSVHLISTNNQNTTMETPTTFLNEFHDDLINKFDSEQKIAMAFIDYYRITFKLLEKYEKHIALEAFIAGAGVGREQMKCWIKNLDDDIDAFDEFKKYWEEKNETT